MAKIIIFGINDFAELAHFYLCNDSNHNVIAFAINKEFKGTKTEFKGLPIVDFELVESIYPPDEYSFFAPMAPNRMNRTRESIYSIIKEKGYNFISYISSKATVFTDEIGENCFILEDNTIQPFTKIGDNVVLWSGNHIGHHSVIKNHVTFTSHVVLSGHCEINEYCLLGVNSTIRDGVTLAEGTFVAMATSIVKDTEPWSFYKGNPGVKSEKSSKSFK